MVRSKSAYSKKPRGGVDFKKIKRKIGRKLPPPKNYTNTEIKSKAIVLPEQSVATERSGLAVNRKGLTLRELLQQTSHHNAKIRKGALNGLRDLIMKHPSELKHHKLSIVEKLRERICDNEKGVRETIYHLLKSVIFPSLKEEITGPIISLMMAYIFNAMTHIAIDIRLMAFRFFELIVLSFPSSFFSHAEQVLDNYVDILKNNQIYLQDKSKLKSALAGLAHCLSLVVNKEEDLPSNDPEIMVCRIFHNYDTELPKNHSGMLPVVKKVEDLVPVLVNTFCESASLLRVTPIIDGLAFDCFTSTLQNVTLAVKILINEITGRHKGHGFSFALPHNEPIVMPYDMLVHLKKLWEAFPFGDIDHSTGKEDERYIILNVGITEIFLLLIEWIDDPFLSERFLLFVESVLKQVSSNLPSTKSSWGKQLASIVSFIPRIVMQVPLDWRIRLLEVFTSAYKSCKVDPRLSLAYLSGIEKMLLPVDNESVFDLCQQDVLSYQIAWVQGLPELLLHLGDRNPSLSKVVLKLMLQTGQHLLPKSPLALEYDHLQWPLRKFYGTKSCAGHVSYGPFVKLPAEAQELAICSLYYFSNLSSDLLESLAYCCLCDNLEPSVLLRMVEVLQSAFKAAHVLITDYMSFLVTLIARFKVVPGKISFEENNRKTSNWRVYKSLNTAVCSCLSQLGDTAMVLKLLYGNLSKEMMGKPSPENMRGLLRMIVMLDSRLVKLAEDEVIDLTRCIAHYLSEATPPLIEALDVAQDSKQMHILQYYCQPCIFLFYRNTNLLDGVLKLLSSCILEFDCTTFDATGSLEHSNTVYSVIYILIFMYRDAKLYRSLSSIKATMKNILWKIHKLLGSSGFSLPFEQRHKVRYAFDQLKIVACRLDCWDDGDLEGI